MVDLENKLRDRSEDELWQIFKCLDHKKQQKFIRYKEAQSVVNNRVMDNVKLKSRSYKMARTGGRLEDWEVFSI